MRRPTFSIFDGSARRRFDVIEANGVLHHLASPFEGWRVLLALLRPGGAMRIGLYSELARRGNTAAPAVGCGARLCPDRERYPPMPAGDHESRRGCSAKEGRGSG